MNKKNHWFQHFDWIIFLTMGFLIFLGTMMIYSTVVEEGKILQNYLMIRQFLYIFIGLAVFLFLSQVDYQHFFPFSSVLYVLSLSGLFLVILAGVSSRGAARWLSIPLGRAQPSEWTKIALILCLASFFVRDPFIKNSKKAFWGSLLISAVPIILVFFQPDLGTSLTLVFIWFGMLFAAGISWKDFLRTGLLTIIFLPLIWQFLAPYQKERILTFFNPQRDPLRAGYNVIQSIIAVGSGQFFGRGWGRGTQSHLNFLPEHHTDFIFAVLCEELGFLGGFITLLLFAILIWRILKIGEKSESFFGSLICIGVVTAILFQVVINVGMNLGLMPITGIPLPLFSFGGNSLIVTMGLLGLVESVAIFEGREIS